MIAASLALGLLMGLVIGALGGGGSILTVPALVFVLGETAQEATSASLVIVGTTAAVASVAAARRGSTRWGTGLLLAAAGLPASFLGAALNRRVDPDVLLLAFSGLMLLAATGMLLRSDPTAADEPGDDEAGGTRGGTALATRTRVWARLRLVAAGLGIGFLTGFLGVGGGFVIVPVLVLALGLTMPVAVGTSLLVISLNSVVALLARIGHGSFDWGVIVPFTLAAVVGSFAGRAVADRVRARSLTRAFAVLLVVVALYVAAQSLL